jgi:hypothetical protein
LSKTFRSKDLFEFAKRFYFRGKEISAFPLGAIVSSQCDLSRIAVTLDNALAKSWFGEDWYTSVNVVAIKRVVHGFLSILIDYFEANPVSKALPDGSRKVKVSRALVMGLDKIKTPYYIERVVQALHIFCIMRKMYNPDDSSSTVRNHLPCASSCVRSEKKLRKQLQYLFNHSLKDKVYSALEYAHEPLFIKSSEITMNLMTSGLVPPPSVDPTSFGWPNPIKTYIDDKIKGLMKLGQELSRTTLKQVEFEQVNS